VLAILVALALAGAPPARAFCGFYVARGDARLFNQASQVVLVRDGDRTVITMLNDFQGAPREFAMVVPVPTVLEKGQIHIGDKEVVQHLDAFSAPRLVEYFDPDPCATLPAAEALGRMAQKSAVSMDEARSANARGVTIEARYTVGEYDILILSAKQSTGLEDWLLENGYRVPPGAARVLGSYLRQGMKFFVAKVNLGQQKTLGFTYLRPIQIAFESPKFALPIRLGMVNARGPQELFVYALTRKGRVESLNYRNVKLPTDVEIPTFVKDDFARFYRALFDTQVQREGAQAIFTEYAWDMSWCDPCAAAPLSPDELKRLGVFWLDDPSGGSSTVFLTRLHVRYDAAHFPEDLVFQETADRANFQGRYVMRHPYQDLGGCPAAESYRTQLRERRAREADNLAGLTGWSRERIRERMGVAADWSLPADHTRWWGRIWETR
jgi:hypothetical protein